MPEIVGKIKYVGPDQQVTATFKKRELVVSTDEQFVQHLLIEFAQDKCEYLDGYREGESVKVQVNLKGREWINPQGEARYFNQIVGWRIERLQVQGPAQQQAPPPSAQQFAPATNLNEDEPDDLPFN